MDRREMLAARQALQQLAAQKSRHAGNMAKVTLDIRKQCESECRKHEAKHPTCRACAAGAAECPKVAA